MSNKKEVMISVMKDDLRFMGVPENHNLYKNGIENIKVCIEGCNVVFYATDTKMLIKKSFPISDYVASENDDITPSRSMYIVPEFFKRLSYLCKQKEVIEVRLDFNSLTIRGVTTFCTIESKSIASCSYPNIESVYPNEDDDGNGIALTFTKNKLEKFLNCQGDNTFIRFTIPKSVLDSFSEKDKHGCIIAQPSNDGKLYGDDKNLLMTVNPYYSRKG